MLDAFIAVFPEMRISSSPTKKLPFGFLTVYSPVYKEMSREETLFQIPREWSSRFNQHVPKV
jgi:hypothetical protein